MTKFGKGAEHGETEGKPAGKATPAMDVNDFVDEVRSIAEKAKLDIPEFNLEVRYGAFWITQLNRKVG